MRRYDIRVEYPAARTTDFLVSADSLDQARQRAEDVLRQGENPAYRPIISWRGLVAFVDRAP
jgi:hypothetical protein